MADRLPSRAQPFRQLTPSTMKSMQLRMREDKSTPIERSLAETRWDPETGTRVMTSEFTKGDSKAVIKSFEESYDTRMSNNRLQWKNHLNPLTLRYAAEVYPYGGGIAPARELGKHELTLSYLGSPTAAKIIALHQSDNGFESSDKFKTTGEPSLLQDEQLKQQMINQLVSGTRTEDGNKIVPLLPYPIRQTQERLDPTDRSYFYGENNFRLGTIEDAVRSNPDYWNDKIPSLGASGQPLDDGQKELIWREHIDKNVAPALYDLRTRFPLNTDTYVPTLIKGSEPTLQVWTGDGVKWDGVQSPEEFRKANTILEPATHSMDDNGNVVSARSKELMGAIAADKTMIEEGLMPVDNPQEAVEQMNATLNSLQAGNQVYASWRSIDGFNPDSSAEINYAAQFWGGAEDQCKEYYDNNNSKDLRERWQAREQEIAIKQGKWETNYLFPEFEPGLWSSVDTINKKYLDDFVDADTDTNLPRDSYNNPLMVDLRENTAQGMSSAANLLATNNMQKDEEITYSDGRDSNTARHRMAQNMKIDMEKLSMTNEMGNPTYITRTEDPERGLIIEDFVKDPTWKEYAKVKGDLDNYTDQSGQKTRD